jgi:hypothetical protein
MSYNPTPPRVWSRVQNACIFEDNSLAKTEYELMLYKGNILQYKANSARLTKSQKYTQLAKMVGPNRTKIFATQSQTYTNPNTTGLLRVTYETFPFPNIQVGAPNNISGPFAYGMTNPNNCTQNYDIKVGGTLICGAYANPCSNEVVKSPAVDTNICNSASASNVPGNEFLCWNKKIQPWFPKKRYTMNNSTDKWPYNYKGFVSAIHR